MGAPVQAMKPLEGLRAISYDLDDYCYMFALSQNELQMKILNYQAGVDSFGEQMANRQLAVKNIDPLYQWPLTQIKTLQATAQQALRENLKQHPTYYYQPEYIEKLLPRQNAGVFFKDFSAGLTGGRYVAAQLPNLPFANETFDLALVKFFLFTDTHSLSLAFHLQAIQELLRVANEVRIYPLVTRQGEISPWVGEVIAQLQKLNCDSEIMVSKLQLQNQGNTLLRVWNSSCSVAAHQRT